MAFIFTYMMFFLKWAVSSTFKLLSFVFNEMVCNLYFKIMLIFLLLKSGDIEMNPGPNNINNSLSILHSNIRSIRNKFDYLTENFLDFDILCFSESHLDANITTESLIMSGNFNLNMENNIVLFRAVHRYIHATKRFKTSWLFAWSFLWNIFCILISIRMTNLFYSQVEGVPGSRTFICFFLFFLFLFFVCFSFNYPILIT